MNRAYEEAFVEVDEIFKIMPIDLLSKIPIKFRQVISENKATDYKVEIQENFDEQNLKQETIAILGLIYRDFLASPEEREELQAQDAEELRKIEQDMQEKYNTENIFKKKNQKDDDELLRDMVLYKEPGFLKKFFNLIKGIFNKNKF